FTSEFCADQHWAEARGVFARDARARRAGARSLGGPRLRRMRAHYHRHARAHGTRNSSDGTGTEGNRLDGRQEVKKRTAAIDRKTAETEIHLKLTIEGAGRYKIATGIRFFDHMLELFTRHG